MNGKFITTPPSATTWIDLLPGESMTLDTITDVRRAMIRFPGRFAWRTSDDGKFELLRIVRGGRIDVRARIIEICTKENGASLGKITNTMKTTSRKVVSDELAKLVDDGILEVKEVQHKYNKLLYTVYSIKH